jgi:hypothetical protein
MRGCTWYGGISRGAEGVEAIAVDEYVEVIEPASGSLPVSEVHIHILIVLHCTFHLSKKKSGGVNRPLFLLRYGQFGPENCRRCYWY